MNQNSTINNDKQQTRISKYFINSGQGFLNIRASDNSEKQPGSLKVQQGVKESLSSKSLCERKVVFLNNLLIGPGIGEIIYM